MNKVMITTIVATLIGSNAIAGADVIAPPVLKYQTDIPVVPKRRVEFTKDQARSWAVSKEVATRIIEKK